MKNYILIIMFALSGSLLAQQGSNVRLKDIARVAGVRDNPLTGYGLVFGLAGTGDSSRHSATMQSVANTLRTYGVNVSLENISSRNVAAVIVTAKLPAFAEPGQKLDIQVSSSGDARSLNGGTLLLTPLMGPNGQLYALAQGTISVGGYQYEGLTASAQKNHPTVGVVPSGATVEQSLSYAGMGNNQKISILLNNPDFTLANRIARAIKLSMPEVEVNAAHAGKVEIAYAGPLLNYVSEVSKIENIYVTAERNARVVVNERTGTIVSGGDVRLGKVSISQGDLRVEISTEFSVSQPNGVLINPTSSINTAITPKSTVKVVEDKKVPLVGMNEGATVEELLTALKSVQLSTRDIISVLQSIKAAGALDGELIIQ